MKRKRILACILSVVIIFTLIPTNLVFAAEESGETTIKNIMLGTDHITGAQTSNIYFGTYQQSSLGSGDDDGNPLTEWGTESVDWIKSDTATQNEQGPYYYKEPIKWRVLSNADGKAFLLSDQNIDMVRYHEEKEDVTWETSTMRSWLNGYTAEKNIGGDSGIDYSGDNFIGSAFSASEQAHIADTNVINATYDGTEGKNPNPNYSTSGGNDTKDKIFLLSIAEAKNTAYGFVNNPNSTPTRRSANTAYVYGGGHTGSYNGDKKTDFASELQAVSIPDEEVHVSAITYETNGGTINGEYATEYKFGEGATLPTDVTKDGYTFGGWYESEDFSGEKVTTIATGDIGDKTYYAKWLENVIFTVTDTEQIYTGEAKNITVAVNEENTLTVDKFEVKYYKINENEGKLESITAVTNVVEIGKYLYVITFKNGVDTTYCAIENVLDKVLDTTSDISAFTSYGNTGIFTIKPKEIDKPSECETTFTYDGNEQTYPVVASEYYTVTGNKRTSAGSQNVTVELKDKTHCTWDDGTTDNVIFTFTIARKPIDSAITLTAPVKNAIPQTEITGDGYTATVEWSPEVTDKFGYSTEYTATIIIMVDDNHTTTGVSADGYTVEGAKSVITAENSNVITVAYEKTGSRPSSGGDSSSSTTTTTKNDDGSTTKTTENKTTGTKTEVTTYPDGSTTTVETKKDGTVTTTEKDTDGNTTTTVEKADGTTVTTEKDTDGTTTV